MTAGDSKATRSMAFANASDLTVWTCSLIISNSHFTDMRPWMIWMAEPSLDIPLGSHHSPLHIIWYGPLLILCFANPSQFVYQGRITSNEVNKLTALCGIVSRVLKRDKGCCTISSELSLLLRVIWLECISFCLYVISIKPRIAALDTMQSCLSRGFRSMLRFSGRPTWWISVCHLACEKQMVGWVGRTSFLNIRDLSVDICQWGLDSFDFVIDCFRKCTARTFELGFVEPTNDG